MFENQVLQDILFCMFYAGVTVLSMIACCYLLFRRGNAFAPDVTPPLRLRRWTAAFFASIALSHIWYMPLLFLSSSDDVRLCYFMGGLLDCLTAVPLAIVILFTMLQDRRRPLWPIAVMVAPLVLFFVWQIVSGVEVHSSLMYVYLLLLSVGLIIYMVREVRHYGRWLRDNYADLEHKEVWQSFVVLTVILLVFGLYACGFGGLAYKYLIQVSCMVLVCYLLWRVETLSDLSIQQPLPFHMGEEAATAENEESKALSVTPHHNIGGLLQQYCIDTQLYLQHDLTLFQLAKAIGVNRFYLSQYFSSQGTTYNAYVNDLRIKHFVSLYREAVETRRPFTAQLLAHESGYRSYSTFSLAFKQRMGQNVTAWMRAPRTL